MLLAACNEPEPDPGQGSSRSGMPSALQGWQVPEIAALGDSITLGVNACGKAGKCGEASWSTGNDGHVDSFLARLGEATGHQSHPINLAADGARAKDLPGQAAAAVADGAGLVTILVGANDACAPSLERMTPTADFAAAVGEALAALEAAPNPPVVFIASVPQLNALLTANSGNEVAKKLWDRNHVCPSLLANPPSSATPDARRRAAVAARVNEYNVALAEQCATVTRCIFDGGAVSAVNFTPADISSVDYFHPSREGQRAIAEASWNAFADALNQCELPPALKGDFGC
jgi:lysophospholipase L1-like esterase